MPVGTQKDYYVTLGVDRNAKRDQIRKAYRRLARRSETSIDFSPVCDGMKGNNPGWVVYPQKHSVVGNPVLVEPCEVRGWIAEGLRDHLRMSCQVVDLLDDPAGHGRVEPSEISFETRSCLDPIETAHTRQPNFELLCSVKKDFRRDEDSQIWETSRPYGARLLERENSRLNSSQERVLPESCSFRALRSLRSRVGLCKIRKSSNASWNSSNASLARRNLSNNSAGTSTVWPISRSSLEGIVILRMEQVPHMRFMVNECPEQSPKASVRSGCE